MKMIYLANARMPTEKAHGVQIMKMCQNFSLAGLEVELVLPWRFNTIKQNPFSYYGVENNFKIKKLFSLDLIGLPFGFWLQSFSFSLASFSYLFFKKADFIYCRDLPLLFFLSFFKKNLIYEAHYLPENFWLYQGLLKRIKGIVTITQKLKDFYQEKGIAQEKILVVSDGVDIEQFQVPTPKSEIREKLKLSQDKKIVLYTGHLYQWKGAQILAAASQYLDEDCLVVFVGGTEKDIKSFQKQVSSFKNILVVGHRPYQEIPYWLKAADVLVLPNSAKEKISRYYTSPLKMFEYMASQQPIVASDLPSIREVLNANNSVLVEPDKAEVLAQGIKTVLKNPDFSAKLSEQAFKDVQEYTWLNRIEKILNFLKKEGKI